jgi:hypothetical protein
MRTFPSLRTLLVQELQRPFQLARLRANYSTNVGYDLILGEVTDAVAVFQLGCERVDIFLGGKRVVPCVEDGAGCLSLGSFGFHNWASGWVQSSPGNMMVMAGCGSSTSSGPEVATSFTSFVARLSLRT